ncbi:histidine kinase [Georgenia halophila]|uniref:histidine kinase n=1 Tax=Georgenia halophila TaxID=620889 RepID=A0ABP8LPF6_9MICO
MVRWWPRLVDALVAAVVLLSGLAEIWVPFSSRTGDGHLVASTLQVAALAAAVWFRRKRPLTAVAVGSVAMVAFHAADVVHLLFYGQLLPLVLLSFAVARYGEGKRAYLGGGLIAAVMIYADLTIPGLGGAGELIFHWSLLVVAYSLGTWQRVTAARAEAAQRRAIEAEVEAAERALAAVLEERTRIARELHDVVAHAMSVMVVQAGAAELVADRPEEVRRALGAIRSTGTEAMGEMRRVVTMLRDPDDAALRGPQPGVAALESLIADARAAGLPVRLEVRGDVRDLPAGLDLAAYRIVQEALTNARRHATSVTDVAVVLDFAGAELRIDVRDDGHGDPSTGGSGHGLIGMHERVSLYGGRLRTGALPGRGYAVEAELPLEPA